jgi:hypothetical protein
VAQAARVGMALKCAHGNVLTLGRPLFELENLQNAY